MNRTIFLLQILMLCSLQEIFANQIATKSKYLKFELNNGEFMPAIGLGTAGIKGEEQVNNVLDLALGAGYRQIDSAAVYGNEEDIGKALKVLLPKHNLTRKDIFITTKLSSQKLGEKAYEELEASIKKLDCGYIDLYLIHAPAGFRSNGTHAENSKKRDESWKQLVKGVKDKLVRSIGISNYYIKHLKEVLANDYGIKPAVNQVRWNPHYHKDELLELCKKEGILLEAYSSLGGQRSTNLLEEPEVKKIAEKLGKSPAQVLLKWSVQQNIAVIPKASSLKRLEENINLDFTVPEEDMTTLNNIPQKPSSFDPENIP